MFDRVHFSSNLIFSVGTQIVTTVDLAGANGAVPSGSVGVVSAGASATRHAAKGARMKFVDYSPPAEPTLDQMKDALQKGLGRAIRWAREGRLDDDALLAACLTDQRYDRQCEERRTDWLWELIEAQNAVDRFRVPILHALHAVRDDDIVWQLGELAERYAACGDELFRERLYEIVEQDTDPDGSSFAERPLVRLDGVKGFLFAAAARGRRLSTREWDWPEDSFLAFAEEHLGKQTVQAALESSEDDAIRRFREVMRPMPVDTPSTRTDWQTRVAAIPAEEIVRKAEVERSPNDFIGWRRVAPAAELKKVVDRLWVTDDPATLACLLRLFMIQGLPDFDKRLIGLCRHADETVSRRAFQALRHHSHPSIREFAMSEIRAGNRDREEMSLLVNNYVPGVERLLLESLEMPEEAGDRHHLLFDFAKLFEKNPEADPVPIGTIVYAMTPCSNCRQKIVEVLTKRRLDPTWMLEECRLDCDPDIRKLVLDGTLP
jgi:hypothetical protein